MLYLYGIIICLEVLVSIWCVYRKNKYIKLNDKKNSNNEIYNQDIDNAEILIVIPCLREQDIIRETLMHFYNLSKEFENVKVLVVTTEKEEFEKSSNLILKENLINDINRREKLEKLINKYNKILSTNELKEIYVNKNDINFKKIVEEKIKNSKTTKMVVDEFIKENKFQNKIYHKHYPYNDGLMADQLNYVLNNFEFKDSEHTYFSVYNADSIPDKNTLKEVIDTIREKKYPNVIQQYSVPMSNYSELSDLMKGFAIYQSNFELRYGLINSSIYNDFLYTYVVGHGMYFKVNELIKIGGFETKYWCEDIYMSLVLRNNNIEICPIKSLENMQSPMYLSILMRQNSVWFKTSFECIKMFKDLYKKNKKINKSTLGWIMQRVRMNFTWVFLPLILLVSILIGVIYKSIWLILIAIILFIMMIILEYSGTIKLIEKLTNNKIENKRKVIFYTIIAVMLSNVGPIYSIFRNKKEKYKTVR